MIRGRKPQHGDPPPGAPTARLTLAAGRRAGDPLAVGVPLGQLIPRRFTDDPGLVLVRQPSSVFAERFRKLVTKIENALGRETGSRILVVTSAVPEEGKTLVAMNLALAFAENRDRSTLLVDADLRRPAVVRYLAPQPTLGLTEVLQGRASLDHALLKVAESKLTILPSGESTPNPLELLPTEARANLYAELRRRFDQIVVDTPPAVPFTDASVLNVEADGAVIVVRAGKTGRAMVEKALEAMEGGRILGAILNDVRGMPLDRYYYGYDDYGADPYGHGKKGNE